MAIITEYPWHNKNDRIRRYSNEGYYLLQIETGNKYIEAVDIYPSNYTYEETDEKIENPSIEEFN